MDKSKDALTPRQRLLLRLQFLKLERASWIAHWREISEYLLPRSGRFFVTDRDRGEKRHNSINDSTATIALRVLAAGMMSGMTSPARPWFRLTTSDPALDESTEVKAWLAQVTRLMQMVFAKSNVYRALHSMYEELGAFGTAVTIILPNFDNVVHCHSVTAGEYSISTDENGKVDTLYREFQMTVYQLVSQFGYENCSVVVRNMYDRHALDQWVSVVHVIEPRKNRDTNMKDAKNMPWASIYFEAGYVTDKFLRESGFKRFPALCGRWAVSGGDIYGNSPAMEALGDIKQLQHEQLRKSQGIDYQTNPPLQVPTSMKHKDMDMLPGGVSYVDVAGPHGGIRSAFEVNLNLQYLLEDIQDVRGRIRSTFYSDLFMMLANQQDSRMTATEVSERHEEKMLMLGPVLERMHNEILDPLIDITFDQMADSGILPPAPKELQGHQVNVEFVSMLAQAQRAIATNGIDRFVSSMEQIAQVKPEVLDKFDADRWADSYADMLGVDPEMVLPTDKVQAIRQQRAQAQQQAAQQEQANQAADTAQKLASAKTDQPSALTDVTRNFSGYT